MGSGLLKSLFRCIRGTADGRTSMTGHWHHVDHVLIDSGNVLVLEGQNLFVHSFRVSCDRTSLKVGPKFRNWTKAPQ